MNPLHEQGEIIGDRYQIVTLLGQGSTGDTYSAIDRDRSHQVAIKAVSLQQVRDWKVLELFEREAKILANLAHPAIPKYLDYFHCDTESDRRFYLVRELIAGNSLALEISGGWSPDEREVKNIAREILEILSYLHNLTPPVIHRDIKPENIIRRPDGQVFLVDFGGVQEVYRMTLSLSGTFVGTLGYMPPEQFRGQAKFASDLYALGATLLYLLAHCSPDTLPQKRMKIDFHSHVNISRTFANWLEKILEPAIEDRFRSAKDALETLVRNRTVILHYEKPEYSQISIEKNFNYFIAHIPKKVLKLHTKVIVVFILFSLATTFSLLVTSILLGFILIIVGTQGNFSDFMASSLVFGIVTIFLVLLLRSLISDRIFIEINRHSFQIHRSFFLFTSVVQGETQNLILLEDDLSQTLTFRYQGESLKNGGIILRLQTVLGCWQQYEFGSWLRQAERDWLQAELAEFLNDISK